MDYATNNGVDQPATVYTAFAAQTVSGSGTEVATSQKVEFRLQSGTIGKLKRLFLFELLGET